MAARMQKWIALTRRNNEHSHYRVHTHSSRNLTRQENGVERMRADGAPATRGGVGGAGVVCRADSAHSTRQVLIACQHTTDTWAETFQT